MTSRSWLIVALGAAALSTSVFARSTNGDEQKPSGAALRSENRGTFSLDVPRAERTLVDYFSAVVEKNCAKLQTLLEPPPKEAECRYTFEQFEHHGARLLATVRMLNDGREGEYVFRLEHKDGNWKVRA
jgi:hypothetical protein